MINWSNFYTPICVADAIIKLIPYSYSPKSIIDICAGSGNFLDSAINRWNVTAIGIDLNPKNPSTKKYVITKKNALDIENLKNLAKINNKLVVANPPFGKLTQPITTICNKHIELQLAAIKSKRIETNMIVSNMSILKKGEIFAAILPENIFTSHNLKIFRDLFLSYYEIIYLGEAEKFFTGSEVKTRIFIGKYLSIPKEKNSNNTNLNFTNSKLNLKITRGIDNSKLFKTIDNFNCDNYCEVIHFSNDLGDLKSKRYTLENTHNELKKLNENDLLISRVGRNTGKIHKVRKSFIGKYVSDYFYIIKDGKKFLDDYIEELEPRLLLKSVGLTVKYLRKADLEKEILSLLKL
ncbi:DNA methyltransferase family protein [Myroides odoratimimus]|uniref:hypothetical protein n=1 Tax=Myroides odoratimimus TaxID=76832 RepID=UPI002DBA59FB|nr:hypothetical protein [Myroides odoratimimus]MEC4084640.1 hypothetical protein [Myroides odoratimimus]